MKRAFLLVLCVVLAGCTKKPVTPPVPPPINPDFAITLTWNYDFTNNPVCSASVTKGCISGFTVGYLQGSAVVALPNNSVPVSACTGAAQRCWNCAVMNGCKDWLFGVPVRREIDSR